MTVLFNDAWHFHGFKALVLENRHVRVTVLPELGGKIWSIFSKVHDREMLWHNPRMPPRTGHYGAIYDNWFTGGWDEIFPNDFPVTIDGEPYPDHGEIWALPAQWEVVHATADVVSIALEHRGIAVDSRFRKTLTLREGEQDVHIRYDITNESHQPLAAHWKLHPSLPLLAGARLHLPAQRFIVDDDFCESFAQKECTWPHAPFADGTIRDLRALPPPESGDVWFFYGIELTAGYCAVSYPDQQAGFALSFDHTLLSSVWIFATFGGWRNLSTIILEPCTGYNARLDRAIEHDTVMNLAPGESRSTEVVMSVLNGDDDVAAFESRGGQR